MSEDSAEKILNYGRWLIIGKVIILASYLAYKSSISIGEKKVMAEATQGQGAPEPKAEKIDGTSAEELKAKPETGENKGEDFSKDKIRLDEILDLGEVKPDDVRKEELSGFLLLAERKKQEFIAAREALAERENQLREIEKRINQGLDKLKEEREFIETTIQNEKQVKDERLASLLTLYEKMEPKKAGPIFAEMDRDLAVALMRKLKPKVVTTILEAMPPEKSVNLTEYFGRIRSLNEYEILKSMNQSLKQAFDDCKKVTSGT